MMTYEFVSEGNRNSIHKMVQYQPTSLKKIYNLAFGDNDIATGEVSDMVITNNGDRDKVLTTVATTVYAFTEQYPNAWVYI